MKFRRQIKETYVARNSCPGNFVSSPVGDTEYWNYEHLDLLRILNSGFGLDQRPFYAGKGLCSAVSVLEIALTDELMNGLAFSRKDVRYSSNPQTQKNRLGFLILQKVTKTGFPKFLNRISVFRAEFHYVLIV